MAIGGWSRLFFGHRNIGGSMVAAGGMVATGEAFLQQDGAVDPASARAGVAFVAWVRFATLLTAAIWRLKGARRLPVQAPRLPITGSLSTQPTNVSTMTNSSILGGNRPQPRAAGHDTRSLGPSDSSDSGSDVQGETSMATGADQPDELGGMPVAIDADSDRSGTGERGSATGDDDVAGADILPDAVVDDPTRLNDESQADFEDGGGLYSDELGTEESVDPDAERIDPDDEAALDQWAGKLDTTEQQLIDAIAAVGNLAADVEMHLKGSHSTTNADRAAEADELAPEKSP